VEGVSVLFGHFTITLCAFWGIVDLVLLCIGDFIGSAVAQPIKYHEFI
jgi:hypothetical protein